jgi:hypothetical protein
VNAEARADRDTIRQAAAAVRSTTIADRNQSDPRLTCGVSVLASAV